MCFYQSLAFKSLYYGGLLLTNKTWNLRVVTDDTYSIFLLVLLWLSVSSMYSSILSEPFSRMTWSGSADSFRAPAVHVLYFPREAIYDLPIVNYCEPW